MRNERGRLLGRKLSAVSAVAALLSLTFAACGSSTSPSPTRLLATRPALPEAWILITSQGKAGARRAISWRRIPGLRATQTHGCSAALRQWSDHGVLDAMPNVWERVCSYPSVQAARHAYRTQSLYVVGSEAWPNFEPSSKSVTVPRSIAAFSPSVHADQWQLGCGVGDPNGICAVWTFRARYGQYLVVTEFATSAGGIRFPAMERLLLSVDRRIVAATGRD